MSNDLSISSPHALSSWQLYSERCVQNIADSVLYLSRHRHLLRIRFS